MRSPGPQQNSAKDKSIIKLKDNYYNNIVAKKTGIYSSTSSDNLNIH